MSGGKVLIVDDEKTFRLVAQAARQIPPSRCARCLLRKPARAVGDRTLVGGRTWPHSSPESARAHKPVVHWKQPDFMRVAIARVQLHHVLMRSSDAQQGEKSGRQARQWRERFLSSRASRARRRATVRCSGMAAPVPRYMHRSSRSLIRYRAMGAARRQAILLATPPLRPWHPHKQGLCFADLLRAAHRAAAVLPIRDPVPPSDNLRNRLSRARAHSQQRFRFAA
jgi:hypothetical protein